MLYLFFFVYIFLNCPLILEVNCCNVSCPNLIVIFRVGFSVIMDVIRAAINLRLKARSTLAISVEESSYTYAQLLQSAFSISTDLKLFLSNKNKVRCHLIKFFCLIQIPGLFIRLFKLSFFLYFSSFCSCVVFCFSVLLLALGFFCFDSESLCFSVFWLHFVVVGFTEDKQSLGKG